MQLADKHEGTTTKAFAGLWELDIFDRHLRYPLRVGSSTCRSRCRELTPGKTMAILGDSTEAPRGEIGIANDAPIRSGKTIATN
jgi:hypothetical protein